MKRSFDMMEDTSSNLSPSTSDESVKILPDHHYHLGGVNYVAVTFYVNRVLIHLREYLTGENNALIPTKKGITLTPSLWLSFVKKFENESAMEAPVLILEDSLLIAKADLDIGPHVTFQKYFLRKNFTREFTKSMCTLSDTEFSTLATDKLFQEKVSASIATLLFQHNFPHIVLEEVKKRPPPSPLPVIESSDVDIMLTTSLLELVRVNIASSIKVIFNCFGCEENYENQLGHECMTLSHELKLLRCGDLIFSHFDLVQLAHDFLETNALITNYINKNFFSKLNVSNLIRNAKELYITSDPDLSNFM
nr:TPA_asm: MOSUB [Parasteatoda house spider adintovirus]